MKNNGYIFLQNSEEKIFTQLFLDNNEIFFEIPGSISDQNKYDIILGNFQDIGDVTLINCFDSGGFMSSEFSYKRVHASKLLTNIHIYNNSDLIFNKFHIEFPSIYYWINAKLIENKLMTSGSLKLIKPDDFDIEISDDLTISFCYNHYFKCTIDKITIQPSVYLSVASKKHFNLNEIDIIINHLKKFIVFVLNKTPENKTITLFNDNLIYSNGDKIDIDYLFNNVSNYSSINSYIQSPRFQKVKSEISTLLKIWFNNKDIFLPIDLIIEKSLNSQLSNENYFLNSCFAIEIFHIKHFNETKFSNTEFLNRKEIIRNKIKDKQLLNWIINHLSNANSQSFKDRLIFFKNEFEKILNKDIDSNGFINKIVNTRNSLVHGIKKQDIFRNLELHYASKCIEIILKIYIFKIIHINDAEIEHLTKFSINYLHQLRLQFKEKK